MTPKTAPFDWTFRATLQETVSSTLTPYQLRVIENGGVKLSRPDSGKDVNRHPKYGSCDIQD